jgi:hypothetical protein
MSGLENIVNVLRFLALALAGTADCAVWTSQRDVPTR